MIITMNSVELVVYRTLVLHIMADAVAAAVALRFASVSTRIFLCVRFGNDQFACAVGKFILLVLVARDDVLAVFHPLNVWFRCASDTALQCQHIMVKIIAFYKCIC